MSVRACTSLRTVQLLVRTKKVSTTTCEKGERQEMVEGKTHNEIHYLSSHRIMQSHIPPLVQ